MAPFKLDLSSYGRKPKSTMPTTIENLIQNPRFITTYLCEIYGLEEAKMAKIGVKNRSCVGIKGNLSDSSRLTVTVKLYSGVTQVYHWFVKILPTYNENNILVNEFNIFQNEIEFYTKILPEFKKMIEDQGLQQELELDIPEILLAKENSEGAIIILRDLAEDGYGQDRDENGDRFLSNEKAIAAVESIAKIQAVSMAYQMSQSQSLDKEHPILQEVGLMWASESISHRLISMKESYCDALSKCSKPDSPTLLKRFKRQFDSSERLKELCHQRVSVNDGILCLQHGDFHFNNLLFKPNGKGGQKVMIVDWQLTYTGRRPGDISYLLMSSLSQEMRDDHQEDIKQRYCQVFNETLEMLDTKDGFISDPDEEESMFDEEYNKSLAFSFFLSCGNVMFQKEESQGGNKTKADFSYDICREAAEKKII